MELMIKPISTPQPPEITRVMRPTREKGFIFPPPNKKDVPPSKPKGIIIGASTAPASFIIEEEEEEPVLGGHEIIPPHANVHVEGPNKEEQVALALKAYTDTILED